MSDPVKSGAPLYSGRRVRCADPTSRWYGHFGTIKNFNSKNAGVAFDADPDVPVTGVWIRRDRLVDAPDSLPLLVGHWYAVADYPITDAVTMRGTVLLGHKHGIMGVYTGHVDAMAPDDTGAMTRRERTWFIDNALYDGDDAPTHWILLPAVPT